MPELASLPADLSLPQTPPQSSSTSSTTSASPATTLPSLGSKEPDSKFLGLLDHEAGRTVILEIFATPDMDGDARRALWQRHQRSGVNMTQLGLAAKALEHVGLNWRQTRSVKEVHEAFRALPQPITN